MLSPDERLALGKKERTSAPRSTHALFIRPADRPPPLDLLEEQARTRLPELVPIRYGRMLVSPFSYFRGAALPMASDLAASSTSSLVVQLCGDAHLSNFGVFGSPERHLFFDVNDFDETAPGPWEWDVKRLAASLEIAGRDNGFNAQSRAGVVECAVRTYRKAVRGFARMSTIEVWYSHLNIDELLPRFRSLLNPKRTPSVWRAVATARAHDSLQAFSKLTTTRGGEPRIVHDPPLIVPIEKLGLDLDSPTGGAWLEEVVRSYGSTLRPDRQHLLDQYRVTHVARKVVGVGSVGTDVWLALLLDHDQRSPLLLQVKEAQASVLERFTSPCPFPNNGERVVCGQRYMQAASDIFLGWDRITRDGRTRDYYVRQLRDWKGSADIQGMTPTGMELWGRMCGWTLARAHARTGDRLALAAYLGRSDVFDRAVVRFARDYGDQNERDYAVLEQAAKAGRVAAERGI